LNRCIKYLKEFFSFPPPAKEFIFICGDCNKEFDGATVELFIKHQIVEDHNKTPSKKRKQADAHSSSSSSTQSDTHNRINKAQVLIAKRENEIESLKFELELMKVDSDVRHRLEQEIAALKMELMKLHNPDPNDPERKRLSKDIIHLMQILNGDKPKDEQP